MPWKPVSGKGGLHGLRVAGPAQIQGNLKLFFTPWKKNRHKSLNSALPVLGISRPARNVFIGIPGGFTILFMGDPDLMVFICNGIIIAF
jgi:hypothetical protein